MKGSFKHFLGLSLLLGLSLSGFGQSLAASSAGPHPQITLRIHNRVHMPSDRLAQAEQVATKILRQAGVQPVWLDCSIPVATDQWPPACDSPLGPTDMMLDFVEEIRSLSPKASEASLAFVPVPEGDERRNRVYISNRRASDTAKECDAPLGMVLGLAVAHEIGHVLMGSGEHSPSGLMRARWDAEDLQRAARGDLQFLDEQAKLLRAGALARIAQQDVAQVDAAISR